VHRFRSEAEGKTAARAEAERELAARLAALEDAAVAAERDAESPPAQVPPSIWTALLAHPLQVLLLPDLGAEARAMAAAQVTTLASLSGVDASYGPRDAPRWRPSSPTAAGPRRSSSRSVTATSEWCRTRCTWQPRTPSTRREPVRERAHPRGPRPGSPLRGGDIRLGDEAADQAERHGRYKQAEQALASASRIMDAITAAITPPLAPGAWGMPLAYGGDPPARDVLSGPAPR
jgi:hypothetical protein